MQSEALKPCPFCGRSASIERHGDSRQSTIYRCDNCSCSLETGEEFNHGAQWNSRAALSAAETVAFVCAADMELLAKSPDGWDFSMSPKPRPDLGMNMALYAAPPPETLKIDPVLWVSPVDLKAWERAKAGEIWAWSENLEGQCIPLYATPTASSVAVKALQAIANYRRHSRLDSDENAEAMERIAKDALSAQVQDVAGGTQADQIEKDGKVLSETRKGVSIQSEQNVANGWQLVPKEPTEEMKDAAHSEQAKRFSAMKPEETYLAMLAAAPAKQEG